MKRPKATKSRAEERKIKRRDIILILCLVLAAAGVLTGYKMARSKKTARDQIAVYVDGKLYVTSPLKPGEDLTVTQEDGSVNVIRMVEDGFYMLSSTCKNQDCIHQGSVTRENWSQRILGTHVICLPNRVDVTLVVEGGNPDAPDV